MSQAEREEDVRTDQAHEDVCAAQSITPWPFGNTPGSPKKSIVSEFPTEPGQPEISQKLSVTLEQLDVPQDQIVGIILPQQVKSSVDKSVANETYMMV